MEHATRLPWLVGADRVGGADMSPVALQLLRRVAALSLVLALAIAVAPRALRELGLIGPEAGEALLTAERACEAARTYGATEADPAYGAAQRDLASARALLAKGDEREARAAAERAVEQAIVAQRTALVNHEQARIQAERIVEDVDRVLNELEDLYDEVTPGLSRAQVSELLSLMKRARQAGASLFLAYEQENFPRVVEDEAAARRVLLGARDTFLKLRH